MTELLPRVGSAIAALAAVLVLIVIVGRLLSLRLPPAAQAGRVRRLAIEDAIALDPSRRLHLVRCDNRHVLVLTGGGTDVWVGWLPEPAAADPAP